MVVCGNIFYKQQGFYPASSFPDDKKCNPRDGCSSAILNMPVNIAYQKEVWGDYSIQIEDYVKPGITQDLESAEGKDLTTMIDPYSYRTKLDMPKMIIMGTNDEYWPVDAVKNYYNELPGENYIHYEPNVGHGMGDGTGVMRALK